MFLECGLRMRIYVISLFVVEEGQEWLKTKANQQVPLIILIENQNMFTLRGTLDAAIWRAELAEGKERIYVVEPTGDFEDGLNVTDKKFSGNPIKSYRSKQPLKIVAEVIKWEVHFPEILNNMLENLKELSDQGIKAID